MIETLYRLDALGTNKAFLMALLLGAGFGYALERAGFSSSRRLAGVFHLADMAAAYAALIPSRDTAVIVHRWMHGGRSRSPR